MSTPNKSAPNKSAPAKPVPAKLEPAKSTPAKSTPAKSTPTKSTPIKSTPTESPPPPKLIMPSLATNSPGTWRHPRLNEITRRRDATTFTEKNVRRIAYNVVTLLVFWSLQLLVKGYIINDINLDFIPSKYLLYLSWTWTAIQLIPVTQIGLACLPLFRPRDNLADIPLTPAQRQLLGLPASARAPTAESKFTTPPRYSRTPSIAGSIGSRGSYTHSPLSGRGSPIVMSGGSPYSPLDSPLVNKATGIGSGSPLGHGRRSSFGSGSPFGSDRNNGGGISSGVGLFGDALSPGPTSPAGGKRTSVGLNSKWLYEKGRRSSGSAWVH